MASKALSQSTLIESIIKPITGPYFPGQSHKPAAPAPPLDVEELLWLKEHTMRDHSEIMRMFTRFINLYPSGKIFQQ